MQYKLKFDGETYDLQPSKNPNCTIGGHAASNIMGDVLECKQARFVTICESCLVLEALNGNVHSSI